MEDYSLYCGWCQLWPLGPRFSKKADWECHHEKASKQHLCLYGLRVSTCFQGSTLLESLLSLLLQMNGGWNKPLSFPGGLWSWNFKSHRLVVIPPKQQALSWIWRKTCHCQEREKGIFSLIHFWKMFFDFLWNSTVSNFNSKYLYFHGRQYTFTPRI